MTYDRKHMKEKQRKANIRLGNKNIYSITISRDDTESETQWKCLKYTMSARSTYTLSLSY